MDVARRYRLRESLSSGGMSADVGRYLDLNLNRDVFLKFVNISDSNLRRRAVDELAALEKVRSDFVVRLYDALVDEDNAQLVLVEEYLAGPTLEAALVNGALSGHGDEIAAAIRLLYQVAVGLHDIHKHEIIHRDLKSYNIKCDIHNRVKIFDFGLARAYDDNKTRGFVGTPRYAAPEQVPNGDPFGEVIFTAAIDVYAFCEIAKDLLRRALHHIFGAPPRGDIWQALHGRLPDDLIALIKRCGGEIEERPSSEELYRRLKRYLTQGRHRARLDGKAGTVVVSAESPHHVVEGPDSTSLTIEYNGDQFIVTDIQGMVYQNNNRIYLNDPLEGCSVLTFGASRVRHFYTCDVTSPEVYL